MIIYAAYEAKRVKLFGIVLLQCMNTLLDLKVHFCEESNEDKHEVRDSQDSFTVTIVDTLYLKDGMNTALKTYGDASPTVMDCGETISHH